MRFLECDEASATPEFVVRGICSVELIGASMVRIGFITWANHETPRLVLYAVWDREELRRANTAIPQLVKAAERADGVCVDGGDVAN